MKQTKPNEWIEPAINHCHATLLNSMPSINVYYSGKYLELRI